MNFHRTVLCALSQLSPEDVWRNNYDSDLPKSDWKIRTQSTDPRTACYALRMFARRVLERGLECRPRLTRNERLSYALLKSREGQDVADRALFGEDEEMEEV